jgi:hypothetical protein
VCTHGRHDACCSLRGNPVSRTICAALSGRAWESAHIGGDRFAANVVCLPHGVYYGRVVEDEVVRLAHELDGGRLDLTHYRGRSCHPFPVQAAEFFVRRETDALDVGDVVLETSTRTDLELSATFSVSGHHVTASVAITSDVDAYLLTCKATTRRRPPRFELVSLDG